MKHEPNHTLYPSEGERRAKKIYARVSALFLALVLTTVPALAVNGDKNILTLHLLCAELRCRKAGGCRDPAQGLQLLSYS